MPTVIAVTALVLAAAVVVWLALAAAVVWIVATGRELEPEIGPDETWLHQ